MKYFSLNHQSPLTDFRQATIAGQAPDKGLYFPERVPVLEDSFFSNIKDYSDEAIAHKVMMPYVGDCIPQAVLLKIIAETISFPIPLVTINEKIAALELFHGPTLAFKDIGARFMSRCLGYFLRDTKQKVVVLVATSGDTGGAVANGFYDVEGVDVVVLYPSGKVSKVQEAQMTTLGRNIHALEVSGTFDDCQSMVKQAFADEALSHKIFLTSANSINIARWLPQQFYYFFAWKQWQDKSKPPVIAVPSGNFGNICAGLLAGQSGLPVKKFVAACNSNGVVTDYLHSGHYEARPAKSTLSNAMDVGHPSNFLRILQLFRNKYPAFKKALSSYSIDDEETITTIKEVKQKYNYLLDPHGAVGYAALQKELAGTKDINGIFLETAHPVKFRDTLCTILGTDILAGKENELVSGGSKKSLAIDKDYRALKDYLMKQFSSGSKGPNKQVFP